MIETVVLSAPGIYRREWLSFLKSVSTLHLAAITKTLPEFLAADAGLPAQAGDP